MHAIVSSGHESRVPIQVVTKAELRTAAAATEAAAEAAARAAQAEARAAEVARAAREALDAANRSMAEARAAAAAQELSVIRVAEGGQADLEAAMLAAKAATQAVHASVAARAIAKVTNPALCFEASVLCSKTQKPCFADGMRPTLEGTTWAGHYAC